MVKTCQAITASNGRSCKRTAKRKYCWQHHNYRRQQQKGGNNNISKRLQEEINSLRIMGAQVSWNDKEKFWMVIPPKDAYEDEGWAINVYQAVNIDNDDFKIKSKRHGNPFGYELISRVIDNPAKIAYKYKFPVFFSWSDQYFGNKNEMLRHADPMLWGPILPKEEIVEQMEGPIIYSKYPTEEQLIKDIKTLKWKRDDCTRVFELGKYISKGTGGAVHALCTVIQDNKRDCSKYVIKISTRKHVYEISILKKLKGVRTTSGNLATTQLLGTWSCIKNGVKLYNTVMDQWDGNLLSFLDIELIDFTAFRRKMSYKEFRNMAKQLIESLSAIHRQGILHNDLHWGNIFYKKQNKNKIMWILADFDNAKQNFPTTYLQQEYDFFIKHLMRIQQIAYNKHNNLI